MRKQSLIYKKNRRSIQERIEKIDSRKGYPFVEVQRDMQYKLQRHQSSWTLLLLATVVIVAIACFLANSSDFAQTILRLSGRTTPVNSVHITGDIEYDLALPKILLEKGIYNSSDFVNEAGVIPAYWESKENSTDHKRRYGPCYAYHRSSDVDWESEIELYNETGTPAYNDKIIHTDNPHDVHGYCRPGFIIIGAGKCGTSSLYHYVTSHPRALEASQKQIHYFKYHLFEPLKWYYQHFPKTSSFLSAGALITGEASPGYLPYPEVVLDMKRLLPEPRILAIGRNPIERAYSSYKYNYVTPTLSQLQGGRIDNVPKGKSDHYYKKYLFSFEDMMRAELSVLRDCFAPGSEAEIATKNQWGKARMFAEEYSRRQAEGLPPLIDLDGFCYGKKLSKTVLRKQWAHLVASHPEKVILDHNLHLTQAFIGRSLYLFPLEWWYAAFPKHHIYFVCTEELQDFTGESMNKVGQFLGLPRYEGFSEVVKGGAYNVGGHRGYDNEIPWEELKEENDKQTKQEDVPLSHQLRREIEDFIQPYNERLYELTGKRCDW